MSEYEDDYYDDFDEFGMDDEVVESTIAVGWYARFKPGSFRLSHVDALNDAIGEVVAGARALVPGQSVHMEDYPGVMIGSFYGDASCEEWGGPDVIDVNVIRNKLNTLPVDASSLQEALSQRFDFFEELEDVQPGVYLMVQGPLSYGALVYGAQADEFPAEGIEGFDRVRCTSMRQEGLPQGAVWGARLGGVEYEEVSRIDLSDEACAEYAKKVASIKDPKFILCARYD